MPDAEKLPTRLHHYAIVTRDQEKVRHFMEDVLGFPLVATWAEQTVFADIGEEHQYCHTFYGLDDGSALAFFQFADPKMYERTQAKVPPEVGRFHHVAVRVDTDRFEDLKRRLSAAGTPNRERDHGYCRSLYISTDDGLYLEFTVDEPEAIAQEAERRRTAHSDLKRWLGGDRTPNNETRH